MFPSPRMVVSTLTMRTTFPIRYRTHLKIDMEVAGSLGGWNLGLVSPALPRRSRLRGSTEAEACRKSTSMLHTPKLCNLSARRFLGSRLFSVKLEVHLISSSTLCLCNAQRHRICQGQHQQLPRKFRHSLTARALSMLQAIKIGI